MSLFTNCAIRLHSTSHLSPVQPLQLCVTESLQHSFPAVYPGNHCACELCTSGSNNIALQVSSLLVYLPISLLLHRSIAQFIFLSLSLCGISVSFVHKINLFLSCILPTHLLYLSSHLPKAYTFTVSMDLLHYTCACYIHIQNLWVHIISHNTNDVDQCSNAVLFFFCCCHHSL